MSEERVIPQTLDLTVHRLVDVVEMLRDMLAREDCGGTAWRALVIEELNEIDAVPGELELACEILMAETRPTCQQEALLQLWFLAFEQIEMQKARFQEALKADAGPRH
jgi:hypothetical protein